MAVFSYICLLTAFLASLGGGCAALLQLWENRKTCSAIVQKAHWLVTFCLLAASAGLLHVLFWQDYGVEYVAAYTDRLLPIFYRLTAFWAGQPGSMLFWALVTAIAGSCFAPLCGRQAPATRLWYWSFFYAIMTFFCLILTGWSNPFLMLAPAPLDGQGLNPLLQNPGMIFHPPLLLMGYAGFIVPACLGLAQLLAPDASNPVWYRQSRPFWLLSWIFLTAGIILGAWWAYMELGWGGYWGWDPVENSSLLPWLLATAAIHVLAISRHSGKLNRAAVTLMALAVASAFFATYLTRSGVIQSVHAFGDGGVGTPLLLFILAFLLVALTVPLLAPASGQELAAPLSREGALILTAWILLALTAIISLATMWPVLSRLWTTTAQGLDPSFYNRVCLPLGVFLPCLLAICMALGWQRGLKNHILPIVALCAFVLAFCAFWVLGYHKPLALVAASAALAALCAMLAKAADRRLFHNKTRLAALGAHLGFAILCLGVAFSGAYTVKKEMLLAPGQSDAISGCVITLNSIEEGERPGYNFLQANLSAVKDHKSLGLLKPERRIYAKFGDMQFSEVDVLSGLGRDVYASLLGMDEEHRVLVEISLEPLVNWIWIGGSLMCLLPLLGLGGRKSS
ncbi:MAG: heme lyase CcmF/NrfE family subunit [Desulfovibrio sp.]|nr:heme lyase CcmF/NrfE family subunit [Desulfovibrio sp.]